MHLDTQQDQVGKAFPRWFFRWDEMLVAQLSFTTTFNPDMKKEKLNCFMTFGRSNGFFSPDHISLISGGVIYSILGGSGWKNPVMTSCLS